MPTNRRTTNTEESQRALTRRVDQFAQELSSTVRDVLPDVDDHFTVLGSGARERQTLRQRTRSGFPLRVDGRPLLRLVVSYRCRWNDARQYLAVEKSEFKVFVEQAAQPLLRFDYLRDAAGTVPCAHVNVHAHRDEVVFAMMRSGVQDRGRERARTVAEGRIPSMRELHIPLGGHRFRPCLEDVLQMLIVEFGLDRRDGYQAALDDGRRRYRTQQLRTAASDDPESVADLLRGLGYTVEPPTVPPRPRIDRLTAY